MKKRQSLRSLQEFQAYINILKDRMGLKDWTIKVNPEEAPDGVCAQISLTSYRKYATVKFSKKTREFDDIIEQRNTIVHELIHCHFHTIELSLLPKTVKGNVMIGLEQGIDGLADTLSPLMPFPMRN